MCVCVCVRDTFYILEQITININQYSIFRIEKIIVQKRSTKKIKAFLSQLTKYCKK